MTFCIIWDPLPHTGDGLRSFRQSNLKTDLFRGHDMEQTSLLMWNSLCRSATNALFDLEFSHQVHDRGKGGTGYRQKDQIHRTVLDLLFERR